jgi:hypothetical protein
MAQRTVYDCDCCGAKNADTQNISVAIDRAMDGAGSMETEYQSVDLCGKCMKKAIEELLQPFTFAMGKQWIERVHRVK